ncbi:hypothetical protein BGZ68_006293 [Mortierella alpina]|nr:hypothetical protein BGZ68_006293 [Mortierella alpina]
MKAFAAVLITLGSVVFSVMSSPALENVSQGGGLLNSLNKRAEVGTLYYDNAKTSEENNMQCTPGACLKIPGGAKGVSSSCQKNAQLYRTSSCTGKFKLIKPNEAFAFEKPYKYDKFQ